MLKQKTYDINKRVTGILGEVLTHDQGPTTHELLMHEPHVKTSPND